MQSEVVEEPEAPQDEQKLAEEEEKKEEEKKEEEKKEGEEVPENADKEDTMVGVIE